jgi:hypothetical protein
MPERAHVTSVEALEAFRASLIVYLSKARPALEEVSADLVRMRLWLEQDQRRYWENQVRYRARLLQEAEANLFSARLSPLRDASAVEQTAVLHARRALSEAEDKLRYVKGWARKFLAECEPMMRPIASLEGLLAHDLARGVVWLTEAVKNLEAYADVRRELATHSPPVAAMADATTGDPSPPSAIPGSQDSPSGEESESA